MITKFLTKASALSMQFYNLAWTLIYLLPYIIYLDSSHLNQLTWWCWTVQTIFFVLTHLLHHPLWSYPRKLIMLDKTTIRNNPFVIILYSSVHGIVWYVFIGFNYIIYHNPTLVCTQIQDGDKYISNVNIIIHYYIVTGIYIWTMYRYHWVKRQVLRHITNIINYTLFTTSWLSVVFFYLCYWKFNFVGIFENYHLNNVSYYYTIPYFIFNALFTIQSNAILVYLIKKHNTVIRNSRRQLNTYRLTKNSLVLTRNSRNNSL